MIGLESDINLAKDQIENKIKELEQQKLDEQLRSFTIEITTQSVFIPKIIGKKGNLNISCDFSKF